MTSNLLRNNSDLVHMFCAGCASLTQMHHAGPGTSMQHILRRGKANMPLKININWLSKLITRSNQDDCADSVLPSGVLLSRETLISFHENIHYCPQVQNPQVGVSNVFAIKGNQYVNFLSPWARGQFREKHIRLWSFDWAAFFLTA